MYTGIVLGTEKVCALDKHTGYNTLTLSNNKGFLDDVFTGASVAINGVCLTVTEILAEQKQVKFDIAEQTNQLTTLRVPAALVVDQALETWDHRVSEALLDHCLVGCRVVNGLLVLVAHVVCQRRLEGLIVVLPQLDVLCVPDLAAG